MTMQLQCQPTTAIWQPAILVDQASANFIALENGLRSWWLSLAYDFLLIPGPVLDEGPTGINLTNAGVTNVLEGASDRANFNGAAYLTSNVPGGALDPSGDFTFCANVRLASQSALMTILGATASGSVTRYALAYESATDRFAFTIFRGSGTVVVRADNLGAVALNRWYHIRAWYDSDDQTIGISVNNGAPDVTAAAGAKASNANGFRIGQWPGIGAYWTGRIMGVGLWNRLLNTYEAAFIASGPRYVNPNWFWDSTLPFESAVWAPAGGETGEVDQPTTPTAPTGILAVNAPPMTVSFTDNTAGLYEHEIWRDDGTGSNFEIIATLDPGVTSYEDDDGTAVNTYRVRAIGRGQPSAFITAGGTYYMTNGRVLLKSDDALWYSVGMSTTDGVTTLDIEQTDTAAPSYGAQFLSFDVGGSSYSLRLITEDGIVDYQVSQTTEGTNPIASLNLASDDYQLYTLSIVQDGVFTIDIDQTPA